MKKFLGIVLTCLITVVWSNAAENGKPAKDKVVTGVAKCAKCAMKESNTCQTVIEVKKGNKKTDYYLTENEVSKGFHKTICTEPKNVKATLVLAGQKGKKVYTAKTIELAK